VFSSEILKYLLGLFHILRRILRQLLDRFLLDLLHLLLVEAGELFLGFSNAVEKELSIPYKIAE